MWLRWELSKTEEHYGDIVAFEGDGNHVAETTRQKGWNAEQTVT